MHSEIRGGFHTGALEGWTSFAPPKWINFALPVESCHGEAVVPRCETTCLTG